jgi:hypothetical protein
VRTHAFLFCLSWFLDIFYCCVFFYTRSVWKVRGLMAVYCCDAEGGITVAHCPQFTNFSNGPRSCSAILKRVLLKRPQLKRWQRLEGRRSRHYYVTPTTTTWYYNSTAFLCITAAHCRQSTNFSNGPRIFNIRRNVLLQHYQSVYRLGDGLDDRGSISGRGNADHSPPSSDEVKECTPPIRIHGVVLS